MLLKPSFAEAHSNLGNTLNDVGKLDEALVCYRRALELKPDFAEAYNNLGNFWKDQRKLDDAVACYQRALELKPDSALPHNNIGNALKDQGKVDEAITRFRRALELKPEYAEAHSNLVYTQVFSPGYDAQALYEEHRRWNQLHAAPLAQFIKPHLNDRCPDRRLRVGYVSPDFREHVMGWMLGLLFREHNRHQLELFAYANVLRPDRLTRQFQESAHAWRNTVGMSNEKLAQLVRDDGVDILVDMAMHMSNNRLLAFARKPAPVQVAFGYPGTTGLSAMDYRITDYHVDPPGLDDNCYSEESFRLADSFWCYDPTTIEPAVNSSPALENGFVTFGSLNNPCKINFPVIELWSKVLRATDRSRLIMLAAEGTARQRLLTLLHQQGIAADRVSFDGHQPHQRYLKFYHDIDIGLDPFPYNGHTTEP